MIVQTQCTSFKVNLLSGLENFANGTPYTYKIALYTANADLTATTTTYTTQEEITGTNYTAGGEVLTVIPPTSSNTTAFISFANVVWSSATFTCRGALIYNSNTSAAVAVLNFGSDKTVSNQTFTVTFPAATSDTAVIRIA
jgi:hypothetical protein